MPFVSPEGLRTKRFLQYLKEYGIAVVVTFIFGCLIQEFLLNWRPALNAKHKIAYLLKRDPFSEPSISFELFWWIIYGAPFVITIIVGIMVSVNLKPKLIGIDMLFETLTSFALLYSIMNYNRSGYRMTNFLKYAIFTCFLILFFLSLVHAVLVPNRNFETLISYISWPPIFVYYAIITAVRRRLNSDTLTSIIQSKQNKDEFVNSIVNQEHEGMILNNGVCYKVSVVFAVIAGLAISFTSNGLIIWKFHKNNPHSTISTCVLYMALDVFIIVLQTSKLSKQVFIILAIIFIILKYITVALQENYWIVNQCIVFIVVGFYFISEFLFFITKKIFYNEPALVKKENIPEEMQSQITDISKKEFGIGKLITILGFVFSMILMIAIIVEIHVFKDISNETLVTDGSYPLNTKNFAKIVIILVFFYAVTYAMTKLDYIYGDSEIISNIYPILQLIFAFINFIVFIFGLKQKIYDIHFYIPLTYALISATVLFARTYKFDYIKNFFVDPCNIFGDYWVYSVSALVYIALVVLLIALPFTGETKVHTLFVLSVLILLFVVFCLNIQKASSNFMIMRIILGVFAGITVITSIIGSFFIWKHHKVIVCLVDAIVLFILGLSVIYFDLIRAHHFVNLEVLVLTFITCLQLIIFGFILVFSKRFYTINFVFVIIGSILLFAICYMFLSKKWYYVLTESLITAFIIIAFIICHFIVSKDVASFIAGVIISLWIICLIYSLYNLRVTNKGGKIAVSDYFFPVFYYDNKHFNEIKNVGLCFGFMFWAPLISGTILITYYTIPALGFLLECIAFVVPFFIVFYFLLKTDIESVDVLQYINTRQAIETSINSAMQASSTDFHSNSDTSKFYNYADFIRFIDNDENASRQKVEFYCAFRAQLIITSDVMTIKNMRIISSFLKSVESYWPFIDDAIKKRLLPDPTIRVQISQIVEQINNLKQGEENTLMDRVNQLIKKGSRINHKVYAFIKANLPEKVINYYNAIVKELQENPKVRYVDESFAPGRDPVDEDAELLSKVKFYRAEDLYTGNFEKGQLEDFKSGNDMINDDAIAAVLLAYANKKDANLGVFSQVFKEKGLFVLNFLYKGYGYFVLVDSSVPYRERDSILLEPAKRASSSWWFSIVEKAMAKVLGSYSSLDDLCLPPDLMTFFDNGVLRCYNLQSDETQQIAESGELFMQINDAIHNNGLVCATRVSKEGISNYAVVESIYEDDNSESLRLFGMKEYKGSKNFKISLDEFLTNFKFVYTMNDYKSFYLYELKYNFSAEDEPQIDPYDENCESLLEVANVSLRCLASNNTLTIGLSHSAQNSPVTAYLVYNYGRPIDRIYVGRDYRTYEFKEEEYCAGTTPFVQWNVDKKKEPWTLALVRKQLMIDSSCVLKIWSPNKLELTVLETGSHRHPQVEIKENEPNQ